MGGAIFILIFLLFIYNRCANNATVARNVAIAIEKNEFVIGVSHALWEDAGKPGQSIYKSGQSIFKVGIYGAVHWFCFILICGFIYIIIIYNLKVPATAQVKDAPSSNNPITITANPVINIQIDPQQTIKRIKTNNSPVAKTKQPCPEKAAE